MDLEKVMVSINGKIQEVLTLVSGNRVNSMVMVITQRIIKLQKLVIIKTEN